MDWHKKGLNILDKNTMKITPYAGNVLLCENISFLLCDTAGNMWIGTKNGLFKHNSKTGKLISYQNKIPSEHINSIYENLHGQIWILLWSRGIYQYQPETDNFLAFPPIG
ncbi:MAG: hypothetical protein LBG15_00280 [Dysgonamonadaceae bacterium]|jgi:ligand-binding sensor domain-containing protein|nr:hypothetical protein [Dysgonamonadaceae bacterium]